MDSSTRRDYDDELAQQAPLVPDIGTADRGRTTIDEIRAELSTLRAQLDRIEGAMDDGRGQ